MQNPLSDLGYHYQEYSFKGIRKNEEIIHVVRRHWLILFFKSIPLFFYLVVLVVFHFVGPDIFEMAQIGVGRAVFLLLESFLAMFFWIIIFVIWVDYYLDVWIITNERIIDIEQIGFFRRRISELDHNKVQDVTSDIQGLIPTLFNYGYVYVQTAGERERFLFKQVPDPVRIRNMIMQLQQWSILQEKKREGEIMRGKL